MLHDVARLGGAAQAVDRIEELAATTDSALAHNCAAHVRAIVDRDAEALVAVGDQFEVMGAPLLAAESLAAAADLHRDSQGRRASAALGVRVAQLVADAEGARSPMLVTSTNAVDPLTEREREIALLAANGATDRQIADQLFLSHRTVNNHLQHIYDKVGVRGRAELRRALGLDEGSR
jgi:DNA-binding CsgD family transcriptional regulator